MSLDYQALLSELGLEVSPQKPETSSLPFSKITDQTFQTKTPDSTIKKVKLVLNVNFKDGSAEQLILYTNDDPQVRVKDFCEKNNLDVAAQDVLLRQVQLNSEQAHSEKRPQTSNYYSTKKTNYTSNGHTTVQHPGERLYNLAQLRQKQKQSQIEQREQYITQSELEQCKQVPDISKNSNIILNRMGYKKGFMKDKKGFQNYEQMYQEQDKECTFHPKINQISKIMCSFIRNNNQLNVFDELYEQAKIKQNAIPEQDNEECTFQPAITQYSQISNYLADDFLTRMERNQQLAKEKMIDIKLKHECTDPKTQQTLFKPKIGRSPQFRNSNEPIHEKLYKEHFRGQEKSQQSEEIVKPTFTNEYSQDLVFEQRRNQLKKIFEQLDLDGDGLIECNQHEILNLNSNIQKILQPILSDIFEMGYLIDFEDFFEIAYNYIQKLPQSDKEQIFLQKQRVDIQKYSFTPKVNNRSKQICEKLLNYPTCNCQICQDSEKVKYQIQES